MADKIQKSLPLLILLGVGLGVLCGYYLPGVSNGLEFLGRLFLGALKILIIPLIVASLITGINAFGEVGKAGRTGLHVLGYFALTTVAAVIIGLAAAFLISPEPIAGAGLWAGATGNWWKVASDELSDLIPGNLVVAAAEGKYLGFVLLSVLLGAVLTSMKARGRTVVTLVKGLHEALLKLVGLVLYAAPIGLFSLVGSAVAGSQAQVAGWGQASGSYLVVAIVALAVHALVVLPLALWLFGHRSPFVFYGQLSSAMATAFGTGSSLAAYPITLSCLNDKAEIDVRATSTVLPLGAVINRDGTAIGIVVAGVFVAHLYGLPLGFEKILLLAVMSVVLSVAAGGIPFGTLLMTPVLLTIVGMPAEQAAAATAAMVVVDWLVDRLRAVVNLTGDAVGSAVIAESFELKTARRLPRERLPIRPAGPRTGPSRDRRPARPDGRPVPRRGDRVDGPRRGPVPPRPEADSRGPRQPNQGNRDDRSPFQMKASSTPSLEAGPGSLPGRPPRDPEAPAPGRPGRDRRGEDRGPRPPRRTERRAPAREAREPRETREPREPRELREPRETRERPVEERPDAAPRRRPDPRGRDRAEVRPPARVDRRPEEPEVIEPKVDDNVTTDYGRMKPSVVARELAKVSAQLRDDEIEEPMEAVTEDLSDEFEPEAEVETTIAEPTLPSPRPADREPSVKAEPEPETEPEPDPETEPETEFGRSRHYRGSALKKRDGDVPPVTTEAEENPTDNFSSENVTFGRVKRKRTR